MGQNRSAKDEPQIGDCSQMEHSHEQEQAAPLVQPEADPPPLLSAYKGQRMAAMRSWFREHLLDLVIAIAAIAGIWIAIYIPRSIDQQDSKERSHSEATLLAENQTAEVDRLIAGSLGETESSALPGRIAAARALAEWSNQGRVYSPATNILLDYLADEADPKVHCYLALAISTALTHDNPAWTYDDEQTGGDQGNHKKEKSDETKRFNKLVHKDTDLANCAVVGNRAEPVLALAPRTYEFRQYEAVDCQAQNTNGAFPVQLDSVLSAEYLVESATATVQNQSNLKFSEAHVVSVSELGAIVSYQLIGLDRQFLGNCPGGGHGTLVVNFQLKPRTAP